MPDDYKTILAEKDRRTLWGDIAKTKTSAPGRLGFGVNPNIGAGFEAIKNYLTPASVPVSTVAQDIATKSARTASGVSPVDSPVTPTNKPAVVTPTPPPVTVPPVNSANQVRTRSNKGINKGVPKGEPPINWMQGVRGGVATWEQPLFEQTPPKTPAEAQSRNIQALINNVLTGMSDWVGGAANATEAAKAAEGFMHGGVGAKDIQEANKTELELPFVAEEKKAGIAKTKVETAKEGAEAGHLGALTKDLGVGGKLDKVYETGGRVRRKSESTGEYEDIFDPAAGREAVETYQRWKQGIPEPPKPKPAPKVGDIINGFEFLGGNPKEPKNWKAVKK